MRDPRNPFLLRKSEVINNDSAFLDLFEPGMLDVLPESNWFDNVRMIRSAAGGGKTSMLRLFRPETLLELHSRKTDARVKSLFDRVQKLDAMTTDDGVKLMGVSVICGRNYTHLQDLDISTGKQDRIFFSLLNARIVLALLNAAASLAGVRFRDELEQLEFADLPLKHQLPGLPLPCNGQVLREWAAGIENKICVALDSFGPIEEHNITGHDSLVSLWIAQPDMVKFKGKQLASRTLVMMDDIHQLSPTQRDKLVETVIELRSPVGVWIAERFEALSTTEMLASGSLEGRDHGETIEIEQFWRGRYQRFEKHCLHVADRRAQWARGVNMQAYSQCITPVLDDSWDSRFEEALDKIKARVQAIANDHSEFIEWIDQRERLEGTPQELANEWKQLEILVHRELDRQKRSRQKTLFDMPLSTDTLEKKSDSSLKNGADLFLAKEFDLPYYFGADNLSRLASLNVEQFIRLGGDIFWEVVSGGIMMERRPLSPKRQHALMKQASASVWEDIPMRVPDGRALKNLLEGIAGYSNWYTFRPSAPNDPGVAGTAIRMSERAQLMDPAYLERYPKQKRLADLLAAALAHNLLVAQLDYNCKGDKWMVLNLNRILCVRFDLPLHYGKYKERPLDVLTGWIENRFVAPAKEEVLL